MARQLGDLKIPVFLRFASEMNMEGTNQWHGDPQKYVFWFRKVASIIREYAPNVAMVWNLFDIVQPEGVKATALSYYPGDAYVDWVGVNFYSDYYLSGQVDQPGAGIDPLQRLDYWYRVFFTRKPLMVGEFGIAHTTLKPYREDVSWWAANYIRKFYNTLPLLYPRVKAVVYLDLDESDPLYTQAKVSDYRLSDKEEILRAYREAIASPYYLEKIGQSSPAPFYQELREGEKLQGEVILGAYAKIYDPFISRVQYYLDGMLVAQASLPPYLARFDFSRAYGPSSLEVKVFDSQEREAFRRTYLIEGGGIPVAVFTLGEKSYTCRGEVKEMDVAPFVEGGRSFIPLRFLAQSLGVPGEGILWDEQERLVKISSQDHTIVLRLGEKKIKVDGQIKPLDVAPVEREGRVFLPARYVAEVLGYEVGWVESRQQVVMWPGR
nr:stalk domain-containing protein [Thermanaeromonas toyohensis]